MNILQKAAQSLPGHWYKGDYADGKGNFCLAGHLLKASGASEELIVSGDAEWAPSQEYMEACMILSEVIHEYVNSPSVSVSDFNDDDSTTEDDAVAILEKAAARYGETHG